MALSAEYLCHDCRLWNDGLGFDEDKTYMVHVIPNGMTMNFGNGPVPLHSEMVLCPAHTPADEKV